MNAMIELQKLNKHFGSFHVLKDVDVEVAAGEVVVIVGASGSGKSTLIRCINGLETFSSGRIMVDGTELRPSVTHSTEAKRELMEIRREVGMVFQQFNLFPHMTVLENVTLAPIRVRKWPAAKLGSKSKTR